MLQTNSVPFEGSPLAKMWLIGEAPGRMENQFRKPFVGTSGGYLDMALRDAGIMRSSLLLWNVFLKRPPDNNVSYFYRPKTKYLTDEGVLLSGHLIDLIEEQSPNLIVALGNTALHFLTGEDKITKYRGSILPCIFDKEVKIYPTYHPSYVMRMMQESGQSYPGAKKTKLMNVYPTFVRDLARAQAQSEDRNFPIDDRIYILPQTVEESITYLKALPELISCDIESFIEKPPIVTRIGFAKNSKEGISIPFIIKNRIPFLLSDWALLLREISEVFLSGRKIIFQNGFYDLTVLGKLFGLRVSEGCVFDTMVQQHCVYPSLPRSLQYQTSVYTWQPYYKDERKKLKAGLLTDEALSIYNIRDCCVTYEIQPITYRDILEAGMIQGYERTLSLYPSLLAMMMKGVRVDLKAKEELLKTFEEKALEARKEIIRISGKPSFNPNSPKQLGELLYVDMGFPVITDRKTKKITTGIGALMKLEKETGHEIFSFIRTYRKFEKLRSTYARMEVAADGRLYTSYDPAGTSTWRLSSSESHLGVGANLQNLPKRSEEGKLVRRLLIPDEGYILMAWDKAQAEDRIFTYRAGDNIGIAAYEAGADPHWENAKLLFRLPRETPFEKDNPEHYKMRNKISKHAKHAANYGVGPIQLRSMLITMADFWEYDVSDCANILSAQKIARPRIEQYKMHIRNQIRTTRTLTTCLGRVRRFTGRISDDLFRKAYAFDAQSTIGELNSIDLQRVFDHVCDENFMILLNVHDEGVGQVKIGMEKEYAKRIRKICEQPIIVEDIYGIKREIVIPIDFKIGKNFGQMEDL